LRRLVSGFDDQVIAAADFAESAKENFHAKR